MNIDLSALTERQRMVFDTIVEFWKEHFHPPTIRWLCKKLGIASNNGIMCHIIALQKKGCLFIPDYDKENQIIPTTIRISFDHEVEPCPPSAEAPKKLPDGSQKMESSIPDLLSSRISHNPF